MITDKETIGETNSYQKERKVADVRHKIRGGKKTRTFVAGLVLINLFINALPSFTRHLRLWSLRQADMKDDVKIFSVLTDDSQTIVPDWCFRLVREA